VFEVYAALTSPNPLLLLMQTQKPRRLLPGSMIRSMYRRICISLLLLAALSSTSRAGDSVLVKIKEFGLGGLSPNNAGSTLVEVEARNVSNGPLSLNLSVAELNLDAEALAASETINIPVTLASGEARTFDAPLHVFPLDHGVIFVEARDAGGRTLGRTGRRVGEKTQGMVIALLCANPEVCRSLQQAILLSGTAEEQTRKSQSLRFVQVSQPPSVNWAYSPAWITIVALPVARLSAAQRQAIEIHLHEGGTLVLIEDELDDGPALRSTSSNASKQASALDKGNDRFLETYRARATEGQVISVGDGRLINFRLLSGQSFTDYFRHLGFSGDTPPEFRRRWPIDLQDGLTGQRTGEADWLVRRLGTSFRFPSFRELLLWIVGYLILVGVVNFVVLRRIGRPEWGWISIPLLAILFSLILYFVSSRNHPRNFGLDEIVEYRVDSTSPIALLYARVRISAPERSRVHLSLPAGLNYEYAQRQSDFSEGGLIPQPSGEGVRNITLGDNWETEFTLRRWSFRDLSFQGHRVFAGKIYRDAGGRFHNDSGLNYRQAIVIDRDNVFLLGEFPTGAVVDFGHVQRLPYTQETGRLLSNNEGYPGPPFAFHSTERGWPASEEQLRLYEKERKSLPDQPFSLLELIRGWSPVGEDVFIDTKAVFFGLSEEAPLSAALHGRSPEHKTFSLTIVTFKVWP
jgi:hypothetical protein